MISDTGTLLRDKPVLHHLQRFQNAFLHDGFEGPEVVTDHIEPLDAHQLDVTRDQVEVPQRLGSILFE